MSVYDIATSLSIRGIASAPAIQEVLVMKAIATPCRADDERVQIVRDRRPTTQCAALC
jgi:hypothetical protein